MISHSSVPADVQGSPIQRCFEFFEAALFDVGPLGFYSRTIAPEELAALSAVVVETSRYALTYPEYLAYISERSYHHDNGFDKLVLYQGSGAVSEVRVHIWRKSDPGKHPENMHNHTANFASVVLRGVLTEVIYHEDSRDGAKQYDEFEYSSRTQQGKYGMRLLGPVRVGRRDSVRLEPGTLHALRDEILHSTQSEAENAITLFCQGPRTRSVVRVMSPPGYIWPEVVPSPSLTRAETEECLAKVIRLLGS